MSAHPSWGTGYPRCLLDRQVPQRHITGRVHRDIHDLVTLLCDETVRRGYTIRRDWSWGYACRAIGGTSRPSMHSWGVAVDINAPANPMRKPLTTDMPPWLPALWESYGWTWGGRWSTPDPMHFEWRGTVAEAGAATTRARRELELKEDDVLLTRIDSSARVWQVVGHTLVALTSAKQAEAIAKLAGWTDRWQNHVGNLTAAEAAAFRQIESLDGGGLDQVAADQRYARRSHSHTVRLE